MKVLFDAQIFSMQRVGGISRLFSELFKSFHRKHNISWDIAIDFPHNAYIQDLEQLGGSLTQYTKFLNGVDVIGKYRLFKALRGFIPTNTERQRTVKKLHEDCIDLFHPTYYDDYFCCELRDKPFVVTVYDMIHELFPDLGSNPIMTSKKKRLILEASRVIAISENTKKDVVRLTGIDEGKVDVVHLASTIGRETRTHRALITPEKYILFVGHRGGYKNFKRFFHAIIPLLNKDKAMYLVCLGGKQLNGSFELLEKRWIDDAGLADRVLLRAASDDELTNWYRRAQCLVFPSLYEGFGLPVLEALSIGCPVATSNTSSLPEVCGQAAAYFHPESIDSIRTTVEGLVESSDWRRHLIEQGQNHAARFSWDRVANETIGVYQAVLDGAKT